MKIFATRQLPEQTLKAIEGQGITVLQWLEKREMTQEEFIANAIAAEGIFLMGGFKIRAEIIAALPNLKVISLMSVGYDHVDIKAATAHKIAVGHTPDVLSQATADTAFLLMLATSRKAFFHHKRILEGDWKFFEPMANLGIDIHNKTLGIFGLGNIGFEMARLCKSAYGMDIIYHNRGTNDKAEKELGAKKVSFEELLEQSDILSVHANLTPETKEVFNASAFAGMKPNAIFVNAGRGGIHNETDLKTALETGIIWGAGLDVTNPEPMDKNNELLNMPNVSVLPHIGSAVKETREAMLQLATDNLLAGLKGNKLPKCVNPEIYN
jgi:lactate dehydrogenase-like 2-hydroxyacid dehydrogenase